MLLLAFSSAIPADADEDAEEAAEILWSFVVEFLGEGSHETACLLVLSFIKSSSTLEFEDKRRFRSMSIKGSQNSTRGEIKSIS